jgi:hypothetical protein
VDSLALGTVDVRQLAEKHADTQFLSGLVKRELGGDKFDAVVFAGPKVLLEENVPAEDLKQMGRVDSPMFYMNYILNPQAVPWRDAIGNVVRFFRGAEYTISRPKDLWNALSEMVAHWEGKRPVPPAPRASDHVRTSIAASVALVVVLWTGAASSQNRISADNLAPFVPTPELVVVKMLEAAELKPGETLYDLGCGDGRILFVAAQKFANAVGGVVLLVKDNGRAL